MELEKMTVGQAKELAALFGKPVKKQKVIDGGIRIVILQRGWVFVGRYSQVGPDCKLEDAHVVRVWGTTKGLGEIAYGGPTQNTKLDPTPTVYFHELTVVASIECNAHAWGGVFK